jgi:hypothetical protein
MLVFGTGTTALNLAVVINNKYREIINYATLSTPLLLDNNVDLGTLTNAEINSF